MIIHPDVATEAHKAGCAAAKQGKFGPFKTAFWEKAFLPYATARDPSKMGIDNIMALAKDAGLDPAKLKADMDSPDCKARIEQDLQELRKFNVNATPAFFINGKFVNGALPKEGFKQIIDERLKVAEASGVSGADYYQKEVMGKGEKQFRSKLDPKPN